MKIYFLKEKSLNFEIFSPQKLQNLKSKLIVDFSQYHIMFIAPSLIPLDNSNVILLLHCFIHIMTRVPRTSTYG